MKYLNLWMLLATTVCCGLFLLLAGKSGLAVGDSGTSLLQETESQLVRVSHVGNELQLEPLVPECRYCLVTREAFDKMSGFGMNAGQLLSMGGTDCPGTVLLSRTSGFVVMNYMNIASEPLRRGLKCVLVAGTGSPESYSRTEMIEIVL